MIEKTIFDSVFNLVGHCSCLSPCYAMPGTHSACAAIPDWSAPQRADARRGRHVLPRYLSLLSSSLVLCDVRYRDCVWLHPNNNNNNKKKTTRPTICVVRCTLLVAECARGR
eukprot:3775439-Rhodomonas_salina.4